MEIVKNILDRVDKVNASAKYKADFETMANIDVPKWYSDAKFGIFVHYGPYSMPAFNNEWYSRNMYIEGSDEFKHHIKTFGEHKKFGYKDFVPMLTANKFSADEWMDIFAKAGAKYVVPVAEHHDGFMMHESELTNHNAVMQGPKRDIVGEIFLAANKKGIVPCASNHRMEHWWFFANGKKFDSDVPKKPCRDDFYWPSESEPKDHFDIHESSPNKEFLEDWLARNIEFVDKYKPRLIYFDWWIQTSTAKPYLKKFAAYYYNKGLEWGTPVVINYKHEAFPHGTAVVDLERSQFDSISPFVWQSCTSCAKNSWCYTVGNDYKTSEEIVCELIDVVSKNGNLLLNIGPKADGSIPSEELAILKDIGKWISANGDAIYGARHFRVFGEGDVKIEKMSFSNGQTIDGKTREYASSDIRYTQKGTKIFAHMLKCSDNGEYRLKTFGKRTGGYNSVIKSVRALGFSKANIVIEHNKEELVFKTTGIKSNMPIVFEIIVD
ncbi:MAG: alpha-L-fucosidase [Firmicutes bacterium]|nr:alpha-L-fucosidase [Bacillota bacterium]